MRGKWHIAAFSALAAALAASFQLYYIFLPLLVWLSWFYHLRRLSRQQLLFFILCFCGLFLLFTQEAKVNHTNDKTVKNLLSFKGEIITPIANSPNHFEFTFLESRLKEKILVTYFKEGKELSQQAEIPSNGAVCTIKGSLLLPEEAKNPGEFNYRSYLMQQGVKYQLILKDLNQLSCSGHSYFSFLDSWRDSIINYKGGLSSFTTGWLNAIVWGKDDSISEETEAVFQRWGLSHLLAISGLHVGLLISLVYILLVKTAFLTKEKAQWFVMLFLPLYAVMAGGAPSVWRAVLMALALLLLLKIQKRISLTDSFSILFLLVVFREHVQLNQLGFQFSYLVTFALLLSKNIIYHSQPKIFLLLKISLLSQLVILPLQINNFYFFNPLAVLLNLLVVPYFTVFVIPLMFIVAVVLPFSPFLVKPVDALFSAIHPLFLQIVTSCDQYLYYPWVIGEFPPGMMFPYFFALLFLFARLENNKPTEAFKFGCLLVLILIGISFRPYFNPQGSVTMLDVGQGDSFVIELPYRSGVILVDAAGTMAADFQTPTDKTFKQVIKPYLYSRGISKIDALILSHEDHDHMGSVPYLLSEFIVDKVFVHPFYPLPLSWSRQVHQTKAGEVLDVNGQLFYVLGPDEDNKEPNKNSLILFTKLGGLRWLFTGDISREEEKKLVEQFPHLKVDVLKVAHHGSKTSSSLLFLKAINLQWAWISAGENNRYGHPEKEVLQRLQKQNAFIFRTDKSNAVQYLFSGEKGTFLEFQP